jgi:hypothetical protein
MSWQVFLDLEETIIDNWDSGMLVNSTRVRDWLHANSVTDVSIFSFAIWDSADLADFNRRLRPWLARALDISVTDAVTVAELWSTDTQCSGTVFDNVADFISVRGKSGTFANWCRWKLAGVNALLVDDVVANQEVFWPDANQRVVTVNVADLEKITLDDSRVCWKVLNT